MQNSIINIREIFFEKVLEFTTLHLMQAQSLKRDFHSIERSELVAAKVNIQQTRYEPRKKLYLHNGLRIVDKMLDRMKFLKSFDSTSHYNPHWIKG